MNILVTGANGQLGNEMRLVSKGSEDTYIYADIVPHEEDGVSFLDITDIAAVRKLVEANNISAIVNCAAYTNVDAAEADEPAAERLNADAPEILAKVMLEAGGLLVHISTDYVFGGESYSTPCDEDCKGAPTGAYGRTKLQGEQRVMAAGCDYVIIRTAWLYSEFGKNFCKTMMNLTSTKPQVKVVDDQIGTPTYALDLAAAISSVLSDYSRHCQDASDRSMPYPRSGIYHYSNEGACSWYEFAKKIAEYYCTEACKILPCSSSEYPSPVKRPAYSVLDKTKIKKTFGVAVPEWTDSLKMCIDNIISLNK